jgi:hypothetical protein
MPRDRFPRNGRTARPTKIYDQRTTNGDGAAIAASAGWRRTSAFRASRGGVQRPARHRQLVNLPGATSPRHRHPQDRPCLVWEGSVRFTADGEEAELRAGGWSVIAPDVEHGVTASDGGGRAIGGHPPAPRPYLRLPRDRRPWRHVSDFTADSDPPRGGPARPPDRQRRGLRARDVSPGVGAYACSLHWVRLGHGARLPDGRAKLPLEGGLLRRGQRGRRATAPGRDAQARPARCSTSTPRRRTSWRPARAAVSKSRCVLADMGIRATRCKQRRTSFVRPALVGYGSNARVPAFPLGAFHLPSIRSYLG